MSVLSFPVKFHLAVRPVSVEEAMSALQELVDAGFGRYAAAYDAQREHRARIAALDLIDRDLQSRGQL